MALVVFGYILAFVNPVVGGVLVGYLVWLRNKPTGFTIIVLSLSMVSIYLVLGMVYLGKKVKKLERKIKEMENKE